MWTWIKGIFGSAFLRRAAKTTLGMVVDRIAGDVTEVVIQIEKTYPELSGTEKFKKAYALIREIYPDVPQAAINFAIEAAHAIITGK